ncbi:MAG: hypothetical protein QW816_00340 [Desulfurococcaceae archaeon]
MDKDIPALIDSDNNVIHIHPHKDSVKTMVKESATRILVIAAGVSELAENLYL